MELVRVLHAARHVVVLSGAGISADSGVPTFRDAQTGMWARYDPAELASPEAFARDPRTVTQWYDHRRQLVLQCQPNAAHHALVSLERWLTDRSAHFTLLTQNVDGLHQRAGSQHIHEMHGTLLRWRCVACGDARLEADADAFEAHPPVCAHCGGARRPCVVWFGEMLPSEALRTAATTVADCDVFLSVGTSALVHPVAGYIHRAITQPGTTTCEINPYSTGLTGEFDFAVAANAATALPPLVEATVSR